MMSGCIVVGGNFEQCEAKTAFMLSISERAPCLRNVPEALFFCVLFVDCIQSLYLKPVPTLVAGWETELFRMSMEATRLWHEIICSPRMSLSALQSSSLQSRCVHIRDPPVCVDDDAACSHGEGQWSKERAFKGSGEMGSFLLS